VTRRALSTWGCAAVLLIWAVPATAQVPTPESVLGYTVGADFHLASYDDAIAYFERLDAATDELTLVHVGETSFGNPVHVAFISSADNLANLERYREIAVRLAHPQGLTDDEARALAREGKAIVHIDGGVHSTEVATAQHTLQLAYDLLTGSADREIQAILDNVIFMLWPTLNPDGQNMVAEWYRSNVGTSYEIAPLTALYQKYVGHDNNRDAYMLNMIESRVIARTLQEWEPQIVYTQHQTAPFPTRIWLPPFAEPIGRRVHPLMSRTVNTIGMLMAQGLEERGQIGATHKGTGYDAWYPGYVDYLPMLQNRASFWTETALYRYATPHFYTVQDFPARQRDLRSESLYPSPWRGGWWRLRDAVEYMETASLSVLDFAAKYKDDLLYNRYQTGRDTIAKYEAEAPFAYFVPQDQRDPMAPVELLRRLAFNGIRVHELQSDVTVEGTAYDAGTWVIPMNQEFAELARQVLEVQTYPDLREFPDGPLEQPYDAAGWTLSQQMGARVIEARSPLTDTVRSAMALAHGPVVDWRDGEHGKDAAPFDSVPGVGFDTNPVAAGIVPRASSVPDDGTFAVDAAQLNAFRAVNRAWQSGGRVQLRQDDAGAAFVISGLGPDARASIGELRVAATAAPAVGVELTRPTIGLHRPWNPSMDEGWTRWVFERFEFDFTNIRDVEMRSSDLGARYDVIVLTDPGRSAIVDGFAEGVVPPRYAGGIGLEGVRALARFVRDGGTLVCLNGASGFAIEALGLPVRNVLSGLSRGEFFAGGSLLEIEADTSHPIMAGVPRRSAVFFGRSPAFETLDGFEGQTLANYASTGSPLLSGYLLGEDRLHDRAAALEVRHGDGRVVLLGFRPQWRGQPFGSFRILFNALLSGSMKRGG